MEKRLYKGLKIGSKSQVTGYVIKSKWTPRTFICPEDNLLNIEGQEDKGIVRLNFLAYEIEPDSLCRCTGKRDRKGSLIYENDICLITRSCICVVVKIIWKNNCYWGYDVLYGTMIKLEDLEKNGYEIEICK